MVSEQPLLYLCGYPVDRLPLQLQELMDLASLLRRQPSEYVFLAGMGFMAVQLVTLDQAYDIGGALAAAQ